MSETDHTSKVSTKNAAAELRFLINTTLGVDVDEQKLINWLKSSFRRISYLSHCIHEGTNEG